MSAVSALILAGGSGTRFWPLSRRRRPKQLLALEASVRYLAYELGGKGVRVNAVSAGPVRTVAARSIPGFLKMYNRVAEMSPLGRNVTHEEVGNLGVFLLSPLAAGITGETVYVDAGYHIMGMELGE